MNEPKFKVGDRVRTVLGLGTIHKICLQDKWPVKIALDTGALDGFQFGAIYPVEPTHTPTNDYHDKKFDQGKSRLDLLPFAALVEVGKVLEYGCRKYAEDSWQTVPDARKRYTAALLRHLAAMQDGETLDPESGFHHAAHVATNALFILWLVLRGK